MKRKIQIVLSCLILFLIAHCVYAAEESAPVAPHEELSKKSIRDEVKVLRQERYQKMPYLDRGYIRSVINTQQIREKMQFVSGDQKTLKDLVDRAIAVHIPARVARERISLARRRILVALRALFPEANFELQKRKGTLSGEGFNSRYYKFSFRQPVFHGGILWNTLLQENIGLQVAEKEYDKTIADIVKDASSAYFEYHRALQVTRNQQQAIEKMSRLADISQQKYKQQLISEIEHLNVESLFSQMQYDYETSKQELELAKLELQNFLELNPKDQLDIAQLYETKDLVAKENASGNEAGDQAKTLPEKNLYALKEKIVLPDLTNLVDLSYEHRPELQIESGKLQSARLEERIRWGEMIPHADVVLDFGRLGEAFNADDFEPKLKQEYRLMLEINWNFAGNKANYTYESDERAPSVSQFQGGAGTLTRRNTFSVGLLNGLQTFAEIKEAEVAKLTQIVELEKAEKEVVHDVKQAYFDYQKALIQVESTLRRTDYRERLARLAEHRLEQNEIQISEYLQAEIDLLREQTELHKALKDYFTAKAELNRAVGVREFLPIEKKYGTK